MTDAQTFADPETLSEAIEETRVFAPRFGADSLLPAIATDAATGEILMLAFMNDEALRRTIVTREAHYWSRSRGALWRKGETSGNVQRVVEIRTDCDQDAIQLVVQQTGPACHTDRRSCFYRVVDGDALRFRDQD